MAETLTLSKLIVLYMLDRVSFPMSNAQISEFILEKEYTDYFTIQTALSELVEARFIRLKSVRNTSLYTITEEGQNTLSYFGKKISSQIREEIDAFRCRVLEKDSVLIDLTLTVPVREQAEAICGHWRDKSQEIYASLMKALL